jgi:hypothetical protein
VVGQVHDLASLADHLHQNPETLEAVRRPLRIAVELGLPLVPLPSLLVALPSEVGGL